MTGFSSMLSIVAAGSVLCCSVCSLAGTDTASLSRQEIVSRYAGAIPTAGGERIPGVLTRFKPLGNQVALTFDACGSSRDGFDSELIEFLMKENIPATIFVSNRWIRRHRAAFLQLIRMPLFEIENHGYSHMPCTVNGKRVYGIRGAIGPGEVYDEIERNAVELLQYTGRRPQFYRSGTAYYDNIGVAIAHDLGTGVAGYSVLGDAGATYTPAQVERALLSVVPGDIVLMHMNHPGSGTARGVRVAIPRLRARGISFVTLLSCSSIPRHGGSYPSGNAAQERKQ